jgi:hypothetical protein
MNEFKNVLKGPIDIGGSPMQKGLNSAVLGYFCLWTKKHR